MAKNIYDLFARSVVSQILVRILGFLLNVLSVRLVKPSEYGVSQISLQLLYTLITFLSVESFRRVSLRCGQDRRRQAKMYSISGFLSVLVVSFFFVPAWLVFPPSDVQSTYYTSVLLILFAGLVTSWTELLLTNLLLNPKLDNSSGIRIRADTIRLSSRSFLNVLFLVATEDACLSFAGSLLVSQFGYGLFLALYSDERLIDLDLQYWKENSSLDDSELVSFTKMAINKFFLSHGENLILMYFSTADDWGSYALVQNLGSMVVRLIYQPIEENVFAELIKNRESKDLGFLKMIFAFQSLIGLVGLAAGPVLSPYVLHFLYGSKWQSSVSLLQSYCIILFLMACNGILECYRDAKAPESYIAKIWRQQWLTTLVAGLGYYLATFLLEVKFALLVSQACGISLRIYFCANFYVKFLGIEKKDLLGTVMPPEGVEFMCQTGKFGFGLFIAHHIMTSRILLATGLVSLYLYLRFERFASYLLRCVGFPKLTE